MSRLQVSCSYQLSYVGWHASECHTDFKLYKITSCVINYQYLYTAWIISCITIIILIWSFINQKIPQGLSKVWLYKYTDIKPVSVDMMILTLILPTLKVSSLCHQSMHVHAVWPGSILLADQLQFFILISLQMIMDSAKNVR